MRQDRQQRRGKQPTIRTWRDFVSQQTPSAEADGSRQPSPQRSETGLIPARLQDVSPVFHRKCPVVARWWLSPVCSTAFRGGNFLARNRSVSAHAFCASLSAGSGCTSIVETRSAIPDDRPVVERMLERTDAELVEAARNGDVSSFGELYRRHYAAAVGIAYCARVGPSPGRGRRPGGVCGRLPRFAAVCGVPRNSPRWLHGDLPKGGAAAGEVEIAVPAAGGNRLGDSRKPRRRSRRGWCGNRSGDCPRGPGK